MDEEIKVVQQLKHHRIVEYYGNSRTDRVLSLFIPYMEMGSLAKFMKSKPDERLSECDTSMFTFQVLEGLDYLHKQSVIHRDIKGSNILMLDAKNIKISDFGVAKILNTLSRAHTREKGSRNWMAPEMFQEEADYNIKVDIWSTILELSEPILN
ncbi:mitogen-activated protein kinase kinase kinase 3-like [Physella acuta]|uniref:mitogen-activated protein kinase kinase kinase 3-like n=1 Tax=Physella acuta TaxID=109671 RepID=UPI0027DC59A2|nr:mitogen-activated protein kinase kinase kinase 3-like [Physella acuta]